MPQQKIIVFDMSGTIISPTREPVAEALENKFGKEEGRKIYAKIIQRRREGAAGFYRALGEIGLSQEDIRQAVASLKRKGLIREDVIEAVKYVKRVSSDVKVVLTTGDLQIIAGEINALYGKPFDGVFGTIVKENFEPVLFLRSRAGKEQGIKAISQLQAIRQRFGKNVSIEHVFFDIYYEPLRRKAKRTAVIVAKARRRELDALYRLGRRTYQGREFIQGLMPHERILVEDPALKEQLKIVLRYKGVIPRGGMKRIYSAAERIRALRKEKERKMRKRHS